jgi:hypothetical protein
MAGARVKEDDEFLHTLVPSEENRAKYMTAPWSGGYRWFRENTAEAGATLAEVNALVAAAMLDPPPIIQTF